MVPYFEFEKLKKIDEKMKKVILMMLLLGFVCINGYAQKVYKKDGKVYLECTVASGMPAGSVTTTPKCVGGTASNTAYRDGSTTGSINPYASENDQVFEKLEIDASDMAKPGAPTTYTMDWITAYDGCKAKNTSGVTGWRLPTQRELMLIYIFREKIGSMTGGLSVSSYYWSSTESSDMSTASWFVYFSNGNTSSGQKNVANNRQVRCVREVTE